MKYCEKCGNKLKEEFAFCDKCGAKIEKKEIKIKKEEVKEEIKKDITPSPIAPIIIKKNKGKLIFLSILNILLLAATITFLVLWLTKPTNSNYSSYKNTNGKTEDKKEDNPLIGKWEQTIEYKSKNKVVQTISGSIEFKENHTFKTIYYDKDDKNNSLIEQNGTYSVNGNSIKIEWIENGERNTETITLDNDKLCLDSSCSNYLTKDNNKTVIYLDEATKQIDKIDYNEYNKILNNGKDAIVVVVRDGCVWCEKFEEVVEEIAEEYDTPVYYYEMDSNIDVAGTPTTIIIKNGKIVGLIEGYSYLETVEDKLDDLGIK